MTWSQYPLLTQSGRATDTQKSEQLLGTETPHSPIWMKARNPVVERGTEGTLARGSRLFLRRKPNDMKKFLLIAAVCRTLAATMPASAQVYFDATPAPE